MRQRLIMGLVIIGGVFMSGFPAASGSSRIAEVKNAAGVRISQAVKAAKIHSSSFAVWQVYDTNAYLKYKSTIDSLMALFDRAVPQVQTDLGVSANLPIQVSIDSGDCCGGWASTSMVGFNIGDFNSNAVLPNCEGFNGPAWTRGVIIGEFVNNAHAVGSSGCPPRDWWVDDVWYFPSMVVVNVLTELLDSTSARYWERHSYANCVDLLDKPIYRAFKNLRLKHGWSVYQNAFKAIRDDSISFCRQGMDGSAYFINPSALLTNYTLAYLSLGAKENVAEEFRVAGADGADSAIVNRILSARNSLHACPAQAGGNDAWQAYRKGKYQAVTVCSPYTYCLSDNVAILPKEQIPTTGVICVVDISGRVLRTFSFDRGPRDRNLSSLLTDNNGILDKKGIFIVKISSGNQSLIRKLVVTKQGSY